MTANIQSVQVQKLFTLAAKDEGALSFPLHDELFGFLAQQSCEKLMKALLTAHGKKYPFTHDLIEIEKLLVKCGEQLPSTPFVLDDLNPFAVELRYDEGAPLSPEERTAMQETVKIMREFALKRVLEMQQ